MNLLISIGIFGFLLNILVMIYCSQIALKDTISTLNVSKQQFKKCLKNKKWSKNGIEGLLIMLCPIINLIYLLFIMLQLDSIIDITVTKLIEEYKLWETSNIFKGGFDINA